MRGASKKACRLSSQSAPRYLITTSATRQEMPLRHDAETRYYGVVMPPLITAADAPTQEMNNNDNRLYTAVGHVSEDRARRD